MTMTADVTVAMTRVMSIAIVADGGCNVDNNGKGRPPRSQKGPPDGIVKYLK